MSTRGERFTEAREDRADTAHVMYCLACAMGDYDKCPDLDDDEPNIERGRE